MDAIEKDDFDFDAGRHLDDGLVLFGAFDEVLADGVGGFASALTEAACKNVGGGKCAALAILADTAGENAIGVGGKAPAKPADNPSEQRLAYKTALAAHDAAANAGLASKGDEAFDLAYRITTAWLRAGHAR